MNELPILATHPITGEELIVTRLESRDGSFKMEGRFTLGWVGALSTDQLEFVGLLLRARNNLQKVATDLGVAYNTVRARLDDIVDAVTGDGDQARAFRMRNLAGFREDRKPRRPAVDVAALLDQLESGEVSADEALAKVTTTEG